MAKKYSRKTNKKRVDSKRWTGVYYRKSDTKKLNGSYDVCYYITFKSGTKKLWEKVGWKSEGYSPQVAADIRADRLREGRHGGEVKTAKEFKKEKIKRNHSLDELAELYFEQRGGSPQAAKFDRYRYDKHVSPTLGKRTISSLSPLDMDRIRKNMKGKAPATVWGALELVRRIANYGKKTGLSPALSFIIEMPKRDNEKVEFLTPDEVDRLLKVLASWKAQDVARMLKLAMFSGLRRGEIFKLQGQDIDFLNSIITLRSPKGGKTVSVPINPIVETILREQIVWRNNKFPNSIYIFPGRNGGQRVDSTAVERIKTKAKLSKTFRIFHGLRHHFAVTLANSGEFTLDMIGELLTHKDATMTRRYAQFLPGTKKKAASRAAELLMGKKSKTKKISGKQINLPWGKKEGSAK
ncbi:MAG: site-specific integrase [Deltaproteobacteria bacterium]|jgi:integrase|nr:site-specific integrase [Deltaproteobacteria bacterium]